MKREYIVRKFIMASSLKDALKKEAKAKPDECWRNADWKPEEDNKVVTGFKK